MANRTLSELPPVVTIGGTDIVHTRQGITDKSVTQQQTAEYIHNLSDYSPTVIAMSDDLVLPTTIRKILVIATITSDKTLTIPVSFSDAKEIIVRNSNTSTGNIIGLPSSNIVLPNTETTFIWNGTAWIVREFEKPEIGYIKTEFIISGTDLLIKKPKIAIEPTIGFRRLINSSADVTIDITGLTASTWYAVVVREDTGTITAETIASFGTSGGGSRNWDDTDLSSNQLDMYNSLYDFDRKYCRANNGTNWYRVIGVFLTNSTPNGIQNTHGYSLLFDIFNIPKTGFFVYRGANFATSGSTKVQYDTVVFDINTEFNTINYEYEAKFNQNVMLSALCNTATTSLSALTLRKIVLYDESANLITINAWDGSVTRTALNMQFQREVKCVNGKQYSVQIDINDKDLTGNIENNFIGFGK